MFCNCTQRRSETRRQKPIRRAGSQIAKRAWRSWTGTWSSKPSCPKRCKSHLVLSRGHFRPAGAAIDLAPVLVMLRRTPLGQALQQAVPLVALSFLFLLLRAASDWQVFGASPNSSPDVGDPSVVVAWAGGHGSTHVVDSFVIACVLFLFFGRRGLRRKVHRCISRALPEPRFHLRFATFGRSANVENGRHIQAPRRQSRSLGTGDAPTRTESHRSMA